MDSTKSQYNKWKAGELNMIGRFQAALFNAFQLADGENQESLSQTFPYWFMERASTTSEAEDVKGLSEIIADTEVACANKLDERECEEVATAVVRYLKTLRNGKFVLIDKILI